MNKSFPCKIQGVKVKGVIKMKTKIIQTIKLEMTEKELDAIKTVYRMLYDLEWDDEKAVADELDYSDLLPVRGDIAKLYELGGGHCGDLY